MSEDLEMTARRIAETLSGLAWDKAAALNAGREPYGPEIRDVQADALAELADVVRRLVAEVSTQ